ncbi:hypothetical protein ACFE04_006146 [Oxalis oulophora]
MDQLQLNHCEDYEEDLFALQDPSAETPFGCKVFGDPDPDLAPRVGDEYQVKIPSPLTKPESLCLTKWSYGAQQDVNLGLPISVMWVEKEATRKKTEFIDGITEASNITEPVKSECLPKVEPADSKLDGAIKQELRSEEHQEIICKNHYPVPGSSSNPWDDMEEASFLLGLYIFGKDFDEVKKFVESKTMDDVQAFYYGRFYKSEKYLRWSACLKARSRKCIHGIRIFTGPRQQELMSRLLPQIPEESKNSVLQVSKTFVDGSIPLDEYVCTLKAIFGLTALVEAVGVGKGKEKDLTGMTIEPPKPIRAEVPVGKACASLTPLEIITFLTGGYRLSKAKSNDIFWEAVWPRLLARGWNSEMPNNHGYTPSARHPLVFLLPGIKKFSRKKLVKGEHYFDSVADVLSKVASEPGLLELDLGVENETKMDQEEYPEQQRHCYLKPRVPNRDADIVKFTIVDTSLPRGGAFKVRELRTLPVQLAHLSKSANHSDDGSSSSEESFDEVDKFSRTESFGKVQADVPKNTNVSFKEGTSELPPVSNGAFTYHDPDSAFVNGQNPKKSNKSNSTQSRMSIEDKSSQKRKAGNDFCSAPITKRRRRLSACSRPEKSRSVSHVSLGPTLREEAPGCSVARESENSSSSSLSKGSPTMNGETFISCSNLSAEDHPKKSQQRRLIDLNLPLPLDTETEEQPNAESALAVGPCSGNAEQDPNMNSRRKSTRNRPLTTKALEALAGGYLSSSPKRKARDVFKTENPRPPRRARGSVRLTKDFREGVVESRGEERGNTWGSM